MSAKECAMIDMSLTGVSVMYLREEKSIIEFTKEDNNE